jgi:four helix bundle protein
MKTGNGIRSTAATPARIQFHWQLEVYQLAMEGSREVFQLTQSFPREELYSLTDQIRRSSRSIAAQLAEAWRRRKYEAVFVNKLNEAEGEAAETQVWLQHAVECQYLPAIRARELHRLYNRILGKLTKMGNEPEKWVLRSKPD